MLSCLRVSALKPYRPCCVPCAMCSLPDEVRGEGVLVHFEAASVHEAVKMIKKMSQRDLQVRCLLQVQAKMELAESACRVHTPRSRSS